MGKGRLSAQSVAMVIKDYAHKAGLDSSRYSGYSLRSGFLTSPARNRANIFKMADHSRHKSLDVLREYVKDEDIFLDNAGDGLLYGTRRNLGLIQCSGYEPVTELTMH